MKVAILASVFALLATIVAWREYRNDRRRPRHTPNWEEWELEAEQPEDDI